MQNMAMAQFITSCIGFFDLGTSDPCSISLWFWSTVGVPFYMSLEFVGTKQNRRLHLTLIYRLTHFFRGIALGVGSGLLFTLPETYP